jgi:hypothetical protein
MSGVQMYRKNFSGFASSAFTVDIGYNIMSNVSENSKATRAEGAVRGNIESRVWLGKRI